MSPELIALIVIGITAVLLLLGMRIGIVLGIGGLLGIVLVRDLEAGLNTLKIVSYSTVASQWLIVVPLFILMGLLLLHGGISSQVYEAGYKLVGKLPGGLSVATTWGCVAFGATSGSSLAATSLFTKISLPEMKKVGYDKKFACGGIATAAIIAMFIPPSLYLIIMGMVTEQSISILLMAGLIPGLILAVVLSLGTILVAIMNPALAPRLAISVSWKEKLISLVRTWPIILLALIIVGGLWSGVFSASEAAGVGACVAFVICLGYRKLTWNKLRDALVDTVHITAMLVLIIVGAMLFARFLAVSGFLRVFSEAIVGAGISPLVFVVVLMLFYLLMGCFMEPVAAMCVTMPLFFPVAQAMGINPVWFGVLVVAALNIGDITPPFGMVSYATKAAAGPDISIEDVFRGLLPYYFMVLVVLAILVAFPQVTLLIPNMMR